MKIKRVLAACVLWVAIPSAQADMFEPSHLCSKPFKPFQFNSQWELDNFNEDVRRYKQCLADFIDEQNEAIVKHQNAADEAVNEWNSFVNLELN